MTGGEFARDDPVAHAYYRDALEIFGEERIALLSGNEASLETAEEFRQVVFGLCAETGTSEPYSINRRYLQKPEGRYISLHSNPDRVVEWGSTEVNAATASATGIARGNASRPKGQPRGFKYG